MIKEDFINKLSQNLSYTPTEEQALVMAKLVTFVFRATGRDVFLLKGYAGTGKSSLVGALVKTLSQFSMKSVLLAPTGRAAKVFGLYANTPAYTIHKKIYRQKSFSPDMTGFTLTDNRHKQTLFIVDEASMIADSADSTGHLLSDLIEYVYSSPGCKLILIGDTAQLPPVGQYNTPALDALSLSEYNLRVTEVTLTEVIRQSLTSGILYNATKLRKAMSDEDFSTPKIELQGFPDIKSITGAELIEELESSYSRTGKDETIIITRSNKRANLFNDGVRARILYREAELESGDLLMIAKNNYFWGEKIEQIDFIANGDVAQVLRVRGYNEMYGFRFADVTLRLIDYDVDIDAKIMLDTLHLEHPSLPAELNNQFFTKVMEDYADVRTKRERIKRVKLDKWFNALQVKYAYAVTCHKAQGGQWQNVFIDMGNISEESVSIDFFRWLYTAFTRATDKLYLINTPKYFLSNPDDDL
ncbi:MAG: AAA family ATPase [Muribaculaceae bacterium]|nr:AAA family ATPase [Muribaculaceae bacterium]